MAIVNENAEQEITAWLDYKKVKQATREAYKAQIDTITQAMSEGDVSMDANTFEITQKLCVPVADLNLSELKYKARITIGDLRKSSVNIKIGDFDGKCVAAIAAATGKGVSHIDKLDISDFAVGQAIAVFFI